jgi:hypothetical protein
MTPGVGWTAKGSALKGAMTPSKSVATRRGAAAAAAVSAAARR